MFSTRFVQKNTVAGVFPGTNDIRTNVGRGDAPGIVLSDSALGIGGTGLWYCIGEAGAGCRWDRC